MYCFYQSRRLLIVVLGYVHSVHEIGPSEVFVQSNVLISCIEGHTKHVLFIGGAYVPLVLVDMS